ncbi:regulatory protein RecX [Burkholderiaceae bacterium UC74_6]
MNRQPLSLKARAIALLAQREHSSIELRRKLIRIARERDSKLIPDADASEPADPSEEVDALLAWLRAQGYLNESRFVESRIHARSSRHGNLRIRQELAQHGLTPDAEQLEKLKDSEFERARSIWQRKFGGAAQQAEPQEPAERARQMRFLVGRGFSSEVVRRVLRNPGAEDD